MLTEHISIERINKKKTIKKKQIFDCLISIKQSVFNEIWNTFLTHLNSEQNSPHTKATYMTTDPSHDNHLPNITIHQTMLTGIFIYLFFFLSSIYFHHVSTIH